MFRCFWREFFSHRFVCFAFAPSFYTTFHCPAAQHALTNIYFCCLSLNLFLCPGSGFFFSCLSIFSVCVGVSFRAQIIAYYANAQANHSIRICTIWFPVLCAPTHYLHHKYLHNQIYWNEFNELQNVVNNRYGCVCVCGLAVLQCMCFVHNPIRKSSQIFYLSIYLRWWMSTVLLLVRIILSHFIAYISLCGIFRVWPFFSIFLFLFAQVFFSARGGWANIHCRIPSILICESVSIFIVYTFAFITLLLYG